MKELDGLIKNETWEMVKKRDFSFKANVSGGRLVLAIRNGGSNIEVWKAKKEF